MQASEMRLFRVSPATAPPRNATDPASTIPVVHGCPQARHGRGRSGSRFAQHEDREERRHVVRDVEERYDREQALHGAGQQERHGQRHGDGQGRPGCSRFGDPGQQRRPHQPVARQREERSRRRHAAMR